MDQKLIRDVGKTQRLQILNRIKRSEGLAVSELCELVKMSYMGVKQHCVRLEKEGYLDTWRRPVGVGRPEKVYRLTRKARDLFPAASNAATIRILEAASQLFGTSAPEKLLMVYFKQSGEEYAKRLKGESWRERAKWFARIRDREGYMADFSEDAGARIVEWHSPLMDLIRAYPVAERFEAEMVARAVGRAVAREGKDLSGLYRCEWRFTD